MDRAALDIALARGLPAGGWCPKKRLAEDGPIPSRYPLKETRTTAYRERTELNVRDSDATLIITRGPATGGTAKTIDMAGKWKRPLHVIDLAARVDLSEAIRWLETHAVATLNVAGPRERTVPGIYAEASEALVKLLEKKDLESHADTG